MQGSRSRLLADLQHVDRKLISDAIHAADAIV